MTPEQRASMVVGQLMDVIEVRGNVALAAERLISEAIHAALTEQELLIRERTITEREACAQVLDGLRQLDRELAGGLDGLADSDPVEVPCHILRDILTAWGKLTA